MAAVTDLPYAAVTCVDFEFGAPTGEPPHPICLVAHELKSGRTTRLWEDDLQRRKAPPYPIDNDALVIAYYASAEMGCHLALGWKVPANVLDLYVEFRNQTNGRPTPCGASLLGALTYFGIDGIGVAEKDAMRELALRGGPWTGAERDALLAYCHSDVAALVKLLPCMLPHIDVPRAILRGRYMRAVAQMERRGVPIDTTALQTLHTSWAALQDHLIKGIDVDYGVFDGRTFKADRWARWLAEHNIAWPLLPSGALALDDDVFREMARVHPLVAPIREVRVSLSQMRLNDLAIGGDGRNRYLLSAFRSKTGRNQPSNTKSIFGPAVWLRNLIQPPPGYALAYVDWEQQEFGIAAALSGDAKMVEAYQSGDPYLSFARQAGAVPAEGTKLTHGPVREQFKACALAVQYGMEAESLAQRIGQSAAHARELLRLHHQTYGTFWRWSDAAVNTALLRGRLHTAFGWGINVVAAANARSLRNFPMQGNGAEMLRLACCFATERGIRVCAPVHDALLIEAPMDELDASVAATQQAMADASAIVLEGFKLRSEAKLVRYPDRYQDQRGQRMWQTAWQIINEMSTTATTTTTISTKGSTYGEPVHQCTPDPCIGATRPVQPCTPVLSTYISS